MEPINQMFQSVFVESQDEWSGMLVMKMKHKQKGLKSAAKELGKKRTYVSKKRKMMVKLTQNREKIFSKKFSVSLV